MAVHGQLRLDDPLDNVDIASSSTAARSRSTRNRRERPHIALSPDQPPTTQGKPRTRVFVACLQCRRRKIRCDGAKPTCFNCNQRASGDECCYDSTPRRRGPDRVQGSRTRGPRPRGADGEVSRRRRRRPRTPPASQPQLELSPVPATSSSLQPLPVKEFESSALHVDTYLPPVHQAASDVSSLSPQAYSPIDILYPHPVTAHSTSDVSTPPSHDAFSYLSHQSYMQYPFSFIPGTHGPSAIEPRESHARYNSTSAYDYQVADISDIAQYPPDQPLHVLPHATDKHGVPALPMLQTHNLSPATPSSETLYVSSIRSAYIDPEDGSSDDDPTLLAEPSVSFSRRTWWDHLLGLYCPPGISPSSATRDGAAQAVFRDLKFLFRSTSYWFSFIHVRRFYSSLSNSDHRMRMQPALVLGALATAKLLQSSKYGEGNSGMQKARILRDEAQAALDRSLSARAIDEELAQAAWILAFFEQCCHPYHEHARVRGSIKLLDSIVRTLALPLLDAGNPQVSAYEPRAVPTVSTSPAPRSPNVFEYSAHGVSPIEARSSYTTPAPVSSLWPTSSFIQYSSHPMQTGRGFSVLPTTSPASGHQEHPTRQQVPCGCDALTIGAVDPSAREVTPMWANQPAWQDEWNEGEIRRESCRRLAWMSLVLVAGYTSYAAATNHEPLECFVANPMNYNLLFPGEAIGSGKESVWALTIRAMLLWHSCLYARDVINADFAMRAWMETEAIERAFNAHSCTVERAILCHGREYLFNTRMSISFDFQRFIPHAVTGVNREKSEEWLRMQGRRAKMAVDALSEVSGNPTHSLVQRPHFVWWFMGQVERALKLWTLDKSLTVALDVSRDFMRPIEFLTQIYPCQNQRIRYEEIQEKVRIACAEAQAGGWVPSQA